MELPVMYFKAEPTEYVRISKGGNVRGEGKGLSKLLMPSRSSIELVNVATAEQPFSFREVSTDNQEITIQGSFIYQIADPQKVMGQYNFSIDPRTKNYLSDDPHKVSEHVLHMIRGDARRIVQGNQLESLLSMSDAMATEISEKLGANNALETMGLNVMALYITSVTPDPEIARALGATYREELLTQESRAQFSRRADAVEQERKIRENELSNKIQLEKRREELIGLEAANAQTEAAYKAEVAKMEMAVYEGMDAETIRSHALLRLGTNARSIGQLNVTPELLSGIKGALQ